MQLALLFGHGNTRKATKGPAYGALETKNSLGVETGKSRRLLRCAITLALHLNDRLRGTLFSSVIGIFKQRMPIPSSKILPSLGCNAHLSSTPGGQPCSSHLGSGESRLGPAEGGDAVGLKKSVLLLNSKPRYVLLYLVHRNRGTIIPHTGGVR